MKLRIFARTELSKTMSSSSSLSLSENANIIFQSSTTENEENCQHTNFFLYVFNNDDNDKMTAIYGKMLLARNEAFPFLLLCCSFHITMKMFSAFLNIFFSSFKMNLFLYFIRHFPHVHIFVLPFTCGAL